LSAGELARGSGAVVGVDEVGCDGIGSAEHAAIMSAALAPTLTICRRRKSNRLMSAHISCVSHS
jgi:hypothetical protein